MPHGTQRWDCYVRKQTDREHKWLELWLPARPVMVVFCPHADISTMTLSWYSSWMVTHTSTKCQGPKPLANSLKMRLALLRSHTHTNTTSRTNAMGTEPADIRLRRGHKQYGAERGWTCRKSARDDAEGPDIYIYIYIYIYMGLLHLYILEL